MYIFAVNPLVVEPEMTAILVHDQSTMGCIYYPGVNVLKPSGAFTLQGGFLYYQRQETSESPPVLVCEIKLCGVQSCLKENDLRFSFEIICPNRRTYVQVYYAAGGFFPPDPLCIPMKPSFDRVPEGFRS